MPAERGMSAERGMPEERGKIQTGIGDRNALSRVIFDLATITALALVYLWTAKLGLKLAFLNVNATAVWPPTGIALAAALLFGCRRVWPGIFQIGRASCRER